MQCPVSEPEVERHQCASQDGSITSQWRLQELNRVEERSYAPSTHNAVARFQKQLEDAGITVTVRRSLGGDIDASCGQLRRKRMLETAEP